MHNVLLNGRSPYCLDLLSKPIACLGLWYFCVSAMGPVLQKVGQKYNRSDIIEEGKKFVQEGQELHADILISLKRSALHNVDEHGQSFIWPTGLC